MLSRRYIVDSVVFIATVIVAAGCVADGYPGWTKEEVVEVKGVVVDVVPIADASNDFWAIADKPVAVLTIRPRSVVPATPELLTDGILRISVGGAGDYPLVRDEWRHKKVYLRIFRSHERLTGKMGFRFNLVRPVDDVMPGYAPEQQDADDFIQRTKARKAAEPGATDNPDDAQRLRKDH